MFSNDEVLSLEEYTSNEIRNLLDELQTRYPCFFDTREEFLDELLKITKKLRKKKPRKRKVPLLEAPQSDIAEQTSLDVSIFRNVTNVQEDTIDADFIEVVKEDPQSNTITPSNNHSVKRIKVKHIEFNKKR